MEIKIGTRKLAQTRSGTQVLAIPRWWARTALKGQRTVILSATEAGLLVQPANSQEPKEKDLE